MLVLRGSAMPPVPALPILGFSLIMFTLFDVELPNSSWYHIGEDAGFRGPPCLCILHSASRGLSAIDEFVVFD